MRKNRISEQILYSNSATISGGAVANSLGPIRHNIVWGNQSGDGQIFVNSSQPEYCNIQDWPTTDSGNISFDPQLLDPDSGLFYLSDTSPCIDAGNPDPAYNDACRPPGQGTERCDIGPWGGPNNHEWKPLISWDIKNTMLGQNPFLPELIPAYDWNMNGGIDVGDLIMMEHCGP